MSIVYLGAVEINGSKWGSIIGGSSFAVGFEPTFKAYSNDGFEFVRWENSIGQILSTSQEIKFDSQTDFSLVAVFKRKSYSVKILTQPIDKGNIKWHAKATEPSFVDLLAHGEKFTLTALDTQKHKFLKWDAKNTIIENPLDTNLEITLTSDLELTATYYPIEILNLTTEVFPRDGGWIIGGGEYAYDSNHLLHAKANPGYKFVRWEGLQLSNYHKEQTNINLDQDLFISAIFAPDLTYTGQKPDFTPGLHSLKVSSNNEDFGKVSGNGIFGSGWVTIQAFPEKTYEFSHWEGNNIADEKLSKTSVLVESDSNVTAIFKEKVLFSETIEISNGWYQSSWFGGYWNEHPKKWAYHLTLGWVFAHEIEDSSYWVWISNLNDWYWITQANYPYIFHSFTNSWYYLLPSEDGKIFLYEFKNKAWRKI